MSRLFRNPRFVAWVVLLAVLGLAEVVRATLHVWGPVGLPVLLGVGMVLGVSALGIHAIESAAGPPRRPADPPG